VRGGHPLTFGTRATRLSALSSPGRRGFEPGQALLVAARRAAALCTGDIVAALRFVRLDQVGPPPRFSGVSLGGNFASSLSSAARAISFARIASACSLHDQRPGSAPSDKARDRQPAQCNAQRASRPLRTCRAGVRARTVKACPGPRRNAGSFRTALRAASLFSNVTSGPATGVTIRAHRIRRGRPSGRPQPAVGPLRDD
jgi:hypothetical protein